MALPSLKNVGGEWPEATLSVLHGPSDTTTTAIQPQEVISTRHRPQATRVNCHFHEQNSNYSANQAGMHMVGAGLI